MASRGTSLAGAHRVLRRYRRACCCSMPRAPRRASGHCRAEALSPDTGVVVLGPGAHRPKRCFCTPCVGARGAPAERDLSRDLPKAVRMVAARQSWLPRRLSAAIVAESSSAATPRKGLTMVLGRRVFVVLLYVAIGVLYEGLVWFGWGTLMRAFHALRGADLRRAVRTGGRRDRLSVSRASPPAPGRPVRRHGHHVVADRAARAVARPRPARLSGDPGVNAGIARTSSSSATRGLAGIGLAGTVVSAAFR